MEAAGKAMTSIKFSPIHLPSIAFLPTKSFQSKNLAVSPQLSTTFLHSVSFGWFVLSG
jgi:hypothetical protein